METIHLFVELLDQYFSNVCEVNVAYSIFYITFIDVRNSFIYSFFLQ